MLDIYNSWDAEIKQTNEKTTKIAKNKEQQQEKKPQLTK